VARIESMQDIQSRTGQDLRGGRMGKKTVEGVGPGKGGENQNKEMVSDAIPKT